MSPWLRSPMDQTDSLNSTKKTFEICSHVDAWWTVRRERESSVARVDSLLKDTDDQEFDSGQTQDGEIDGPPRNFQDAQRMDARNNAIPTSEVSKTVTTEAKPEIPDDKSTNTNEVGAAANRRVDSSVYSAPFFASPINPMNEHSGEPPVDDDIFDPHYFKRKQQGVIPRDVPSIMVTGEKAVSATNGNIETNEKTQNVLVEEESENPANVDTDDQTQNPLAEEESKDSPHEHPLFTSPEEAGADEKARAEAFAADTAYVNSRAVDESRQGSSGPYFRVVTESEQPRSSKPSFSKQESAEILCLAFFGLAASLWLSCVKATELKRPASKQYSPPMLQWTLDDGPDFPMKSRLQLWISDTPHQSDIARGQSLHKILWEHSHFANFAKEHYSSSKTSTASNDLFAIARHETSWLTQNLEEREASLVAACAPDHEASRCVLDDAFSTPASSLQSVFHFQQYLQRAGSGGYLWELEAGTASEKIYLRGPRDISHQEDDFDIVGEDDVTFSGRHRSISWGEDRTHLYDVESP